MRQAGNYKDLTGQKFGELTVVAPTAKRKEGLIVWACRCSCGSYAEASRRQLIRGYRTKCAHHRYQTMLKKNYHELVVVRIESIQQTMKAYCLCSCGQSCWVRCENLLNGHTKSCGHRKKKDYRQRVAGVIPGKLQSKRPKNNSSGHKGVSQTASGKISNREDAKDVSRLIFSNWNDFIGDFILLNWLSNVSKTSSLREECSS